MTILLEERLEIEDLGAKNDALIWYLHLLGISDQTNADNFIDNKKDLLFLNERSSRLRKKRTDLDNLLEEVRCTQLLAGDIVKHSEELSFLSEQLHQLWNLVPVEWKDSVFKSVQKGLTSPLSMHPVNAIQALQGASSHVSTAMKSYLRAVGEYVDNAHAQTSRRKAFKTGGSMSLQSAREERMLKRASQKQSMDTAGHLQPSTTRSGTISFDDASMVGFDRAHTTGTVRTPAGANQNRPVPACLLPG